MVTSQKMDASTTGFVAAGGSQAGSSHQIVEPLYLEEEQDRVDQIALSQIRVQLDQEKEEHFKLKVYVNQI